MLLAPYDRIQWAAVLILLSFVSVLVLSSQSAASFPTYFLALLMMVFAAKWRDVFQLTLIHWVLALLVWLSASAFWSEYFVLREAFSVWIRAFLIFLFIVAFAECQVRGHLQSWMSHTMTFVGGVSVVLALANFFMTEPADGRLNGLGQLDTHVIAAWVYGVVAIFALQTWYKAQFAATRVGALLVVSLCVAAVFLSDSRNAWVSVSLGLLAFVFAHKVRYGRQFLISVAATGLLVGVGLLALVANESTRDVILPRGDSFRLVIWEHFLGRLVENNPLIGLGILTNDDFAAGNFTFAHPHNLYVSVAVQGGVIGLALYCAVLVRTLRSLLKHFEHEDAKLGICILVLALSAHLLDGHELVDKVSDTWFLIWLPVAIAAGLEWRTPAREPLD